MTCYETTGFGKHRHLSAAETRSRMEEEAHKLLEEGIRKKLISPGKGELSTFPNGTKVQLQRYRDTDRAEFSEYFNESDEAR